ncbi:MAG: 2,3-bisphosphoglycerate-dependent phosphoglycerate mutase [Candidatus Kapabacteria bacterium]|nr:2,3-bisphosphoglycerate-dependent phosphoglycerate mutase [Candidatus Kapabacteria bacterium]MBX7154468.1 2,3-bisphosphoglycerate-dependent phosphoglycerate mutase [Bacteroidota bacterium]
MSQLTLIRHGESIWNLENRFTGWVDVDLSAKGEEEARRAGEKLKGHHFDALFTSVLKRAIRTAEIALGVAGITEIPTTRNEALNERHYGDLQGLNKDDIGRQYGADQLKIWRRSYDVPPPNGESLKMTQERVLPYYFANIEPMLKEGKDVLVVAHGNSLRALVMHIQKFTPEQILETNIPTAVPFTYLFDSHMNLAGMEDIPW